MIGKTISTRLLLVLLCVGFDSSSYAVQESDLTALIEKASNGDAESQYDLGFRYLIGRGVPKDDKHAVEWFRKAAEQGDATAQFNLGAMYADGKGVPKDDVLAYMWSNLAAASGYEAASENRKILAKRMTREQIAEGQRLSREWAASHSK